MQTLSLFLGLLTATLATAGEVPIRTMRVPQQGIQPQIAADGKGTIHLIYFTGEAAGGDVWYVTSQAGAPFSRPLRVNSTPGSVIAAGNIRGAHLATGRNGRPHVAWMGSKVARTRAGESPMLYTRLNDAGTAFEPERDVIDFAHGLDGGGTVAADARGNVHVAWHAPRTGSKGEENRCVWVASSRDDGKTFAPEQAAYSDPLGACGCCGMRALCDPQGQLHVLFRSARAGVNRDSYLLTSVNGGDFKRTLVESWQIGLCPMSSYYLSNSATVLAAWETAGQVHFAPIDQKTGLAGELRTPAGKPHVRKHPVTASNSQGKTILVWTEGMGWNRGGAVAWQVFDSEGQPTGQQGRSDGVPRWSLVSAFATVDGGFTIVY